MGMFALQVSWILYHILSFERYLVELIAWFILRYYSFTIGRWTFGILTLGLTEVFSGAKCMDADHWAFIAWDSKRYNNKVSRNETDIFIENL